MSGPLVSVIIPAYNSARFITHTINNVFQQTYRNIEVVVIDDGSTDDTASVLRSLGGRIRWAKQANKGPAGARNRGVQMATGEIIAFQDHDDEWNPTKITRQVNLLERAGNSVPCCLCDTNILFDDGIVRTAFGHAGIKPPFEEGIWTNAAEVLTTRFIMFNQASAIRRSAFEKLGGFCETRRYLEDHDLSIRMALEGPWAFISTPLATWKGTPNSLSRKANGSDELLLRHCDVLMREAILDAVSDTRDKERLQPLMLRYLKKARHSLRAAEARQKCTSRPAAFAANLWLRSERILGALERRLPSYPRMVARPLMQGAVSAVAGSPAYQTALDDVG